MSATMLSSVASLSPLRIGALSFALAFHGLVLVLLAMPQSPLPSPPAVMTPMQAIDVVIARILPPAPVPPVPAPPVRVRQPPTPAPVAAVVVPTPSSFVVPVTLAAPEVQTEVATDPPAPVMRAASIAYADASLPPYPAPAKRRGLEGTVTLRILVDESGRPLQVQIAQSSGHAMLDRSARDHVLRRWRFEPAMQDGRNVQAWALVPINFSLDRL